MTIAGRTESRGMTLRRGTHLTLINSEVADSGRCLQISGSSSTDALGMGITNSGVSYGCETVNAGDDEAAVQAFLDSQPNVTQDGSTPPPTDLPDDGFFDPAGSSTVGADFDSWKGNWVFESGL